jgi:4-hydroxybenzoate polyprenyltransferase
MENIIQSIVTCNSLYGIIGLAITAGVIIGLAVIAGLAILFVVFLLYRFLTQLLDTIKQYNDIHAKACVGDVSLETKLHR